MLVMVASTLPIILGLKCDFFMNCVTRQVNLPLLNDYNQKSNADILVIGDSIMAYFHGVCPDTSFFRQWCYRGIGDDVSARLVDDHGWAVEDAYIRTDAIPGARISFPLPSVLSPIPDQYCKATRGSSSSWVWEDDPRTTGACVGGEESRNFDWVILNGGGDDLYYECTNSGNDCDVDCITSMDTTFTEVKGLIDYIDSDGSEMVFLGYYKYKKSSAFEWYNDCVDYIADMAAAEEDYPASLHYVFTEDWVDNPLYYQWMSYYTDGLHPSHVTVDLIAVKIAGIIDPD